MSPQVMKKKIYILDLFANLAFSLICQLKPLGMPYNHI